MSTLVETRMAKPGPGRRRGILTGLVGLVCALLGAACVDEAPRPALDTLGADVPASCGSEALCARGTFCDSRTDTCVDCLTDDHCGGGVCHPERGVCVQCAEDADCARGFCHPGQLVCVGCFEDAQCDGVCHPERGVCVGCLDDGDCGPESRCNTAALTCVGPCREDRQCDDGNACTADRCDAGRCLYAARDGEVCDDGATCTIEDRCDERVCRGTRTEACCAAFTCRDGVSEDGDGDLCHDQCRCPDESIVGPDARCPCPEEPRCPVGTRPFDADRDGCRESCECSSGAIIEPGATCPCRQTLTCQGGLVGTDLDGDGCADVCARGCRDGCDCVGQGLRATLECPLACADCGPYLACVSGVCHGACGVDPMSCACPEPPACGPLETAFDKDEDGCNDACRCLSSAADGRCLCPFSVSCGVGAEPVDTNADGCADECRCVGTGAVPGPEGRCCAALSCGPREEPWDSNADGCADACRCVGGGVPGPSPNAERCPCPPVAECPPGSSPVDRDADGCPERCECGDGTAPGPLGCQGCLSDCSREVLDPTVYYIDADSDGCFDRREQCPIGTRAATSPLAGCPDRCESCGILTCPMGARATDTDQDQCPDRCLCASGREAPSSGCECDTPVLCAVGQSAVDRDGDGCADACAWSCRTACDCEVDKVRVESSCCVGCRAASVCLAGYCASACESVAAECQVASSVEAAVCGCDGVTYANACEAGRAGVDLASDETCEAVSCLGDDDCAADETCEREAGDCGATDRGDRGFCVEVPEHCLAVVAPVCGCDGVAYSNDCERRRARVGLGLREVCGIDTRR